MKSIIIFSIYSTLSLVVFTSILNAQPPAPCTNNGVLNGNMIGNLTRIQDVGNNNTVGCPCGTPPVGPHLLHLLHSGQPSLRFSSNPGYTCAGEYHATLSLYRGTVQYSALEGTNDFSIVVDASANDLILATRDTLGMIKFATTQPTSQLGNGLDWERMRITPLGHVGISRTNPLELLHIGPKMTFHVGYENDYIGYNVYLHSDGAIPPVTEDRLIIGPGYPLKYGMTRHGVIEVGAGSTSDGSTDSPVDWWEGGSPFGKFPGMTLQNVNGFGCVAFGRYWPEENTRVLIRAFGDPACTTDCDNALMVRKRDDATILCVKGVGKVGVATDSPKNTFHVLGSALIGENDNTFSHSFSYQLSVDGVIFAREIWVTEDDWSDFVLEDDYRLMPIGELEKFIDNSGHLPGVPTQEDVTKDGVKLSQYMQMTLAKIEELHLYVIELHNENKKLKDQLDRVSQKLKEE